MYKGWKHYTGNLEDSEEDEMQAEREEMRHYK